MTKKEREQIERRGFSWREEGEYVVLRVKKERYNLHELLEIAHLCKPRNIVSKFVELVMDDLAGQRPKASNQWMNRR